MKVVLDKKQEIDIMIISEGTYPYVRGGVSSWIHQLIKGMSGFTFGIVFIGSRPEDYSKVLYEYPPNMVYMLEAYMFDSEKKSGVKAKKGSKKALENVESIYEWFKSSSKGFPQELNNLSFYTKDVDESFFLHSQSAWKFIEKKYMQNAPSMPIIDYFWTIRSIHAPIWKLANIAKEVSKKAKVIHTPSTGYAGFLAALVSRNDDIPLILTEHGIYTKERKIDLLSNDFFKSQKFDLLKEVYENDYIKGMWIRFFEGLGTFCYERANPILSLYHGAKDMQISYGAKEDRCRVIPNGVDTKNLKKAYEARGDDIPLVVTLIGRVVSIKDIKTFIRAIKATTEKFPTIEGWIVGPMDEDEDYARECEMLVENLNLSENIKFLGFQNITDILPKSGILTLSSISEGMPLVILEGFAAGVPCVATDVGSCRELIEGDLNDKDSKAGEVVKIASPKELSDAYIKLFSDEKLWRRYQQNGLKRVNEDYTQEKFFKAYREIYEKALFRSHDRAKESELAWQV